MYFSTSHNDLTQRIFENLNLSCFRIYGEGRGYYKTKSLFSSNKVNAQQCISIAKQCRKMEHNIIELLKYHYYHY